MLKTALLAVAAAALAVSARAENLHIGAREAPIAQAVVVPSGSEVIFLSGVVPPPLNPEAAKGAPAEFGDTRTQAKGVLARIAEILRAQGYAPGDVVMMRVYLVGDPAKGGRMDFAGMMEAYNEMFGTPAQPNKPARVTVQVAGLVAPGMLCEIKVQAAHTAR